MPEKKKCVGCLAWDYSASNFSRPEGERMDGWCRVWKQETNQNFGCDKFSSRAKQEAEYLASLKK